MKTKQDSKHKNERNKSEKGKEDKNKNDDSEMECEDENISYAVRSTDNDFEENPDKNNRCLPIR